MRAQRKASPLRGLLLFLLGALVGANATYFAMTRNAMPRQAVATDSGESSQVIAPAPTEGRPSPITPGGAGSNQHDAGPMLPPPVARMRGHVPAPGTVTAASGNGLLIPVQGITASQLIDTFTDARSSGRLHDAIDIMAPVGAPVMAVADGHIEKLFNSKLGGLTIYQFDTDGTRAYYYAHLQRYADGVSEKQIITRGQLIGFVGATGNANPESPHLHFAIFVLGPEKQWWKGEAVNPYPRLIAPLR